MYMRISDSGKVVKLLGAEKSTTLIDDRIKQKAKTGHTSISTSQPTGLHRIMSLPQQPLHGHTEDNHSLHRPPSVNSLKATVGALSAAVEVVTHIEPSIDSLPSAKLLRGPVPVSSSAATAAAMMASTPAREQRAGMYSGGSTPSPFKLEDMSPAPPVR